MRRTAPILFNHFMLKSNQRNGRKIKLTSELLDFLINYRWPGNVREMQNMVERMVILAEGDRLTLDNLPSEVRNFSVPKDIEIQGQIDSYPAFSDNTDIIKNSKGNVRFSLRDIERAEVESALRRNGWIQILAARELGITPRQMGYKIKKYNLSRFDAY